MTDEEREAPPPKNSHVHHLPVVSLKKQRLYPGCFGSTLAAGRHVRGDGKPDCDDRPTSRQRHFVAVEAKTQLEIKPELEVDQSDVSHDKKLSPP